MPRREPQERFIAIFSDDTALTFPSLFLLAEAQLDGAWDHPPIEVIHRLEDGVTCRDGMPALEEEVERVELERATNAAEEIAHRRSMAGAR